MSMIDITKVGRLSGKELKEENNSDKSDALHNFYELLNNSSATEFSNMFLPEETNYVGRELGEAGYGESRYDKNIDYMSQLPDIQDIRARNQSGFNQFVSGITKGVGLAATTFLDGTLGLIYGIGQGLNEARISALWDNDVSNALQDFNKKMEEWLPNYRTKEEQERNWWQNMGTANFWADGFLKNLGFTVGAFYSGNAWLKGLKALGWVKNATSAQVVGSLLSGFNEGRIEANNAQTEFMDSEKAKLQQAREMRAADIAAMDISDDEKIEKLKELDENVKLQEQDSLDRAHKMGLTTLIGNTIILSLDNMWQFGKLYSRGFENAKDLAGRISAGAAKEGITGGVKEGGKYVAETTSKGRKLLRGASNGLSEGFEEMNQAWIAEGAGYWMGADSPDSYYKALIDPKAQVDTKDFLEAAGEGFVNTYGNGDRWEEFAIGALTGLIGMPTFGQLNNSDANTWLGKGKTVGISGGLLGEFRSQTQREKEAQESAELMNNYVDKIRNYGNYFVQSQSFTNAMDGFAKDTDNFQYKNMSNNDDFAAISRFARTGRLDDLKELVNQDFENMSDEQLDQIAKSTTPNITIKDDGSVAYEDINGNIETGGWRDQTTGKLLSETEEGREKMRQDLQSKRDKILSEIDKYEEAVRKVRAIGNNSLDESQVNELSWLLWKEKMFEDRFASVKEKNTEFLRNLQLSISDYIKGNTPDMDESELEERGRKEGESLEDYKARLKKVSEERGKSISSDEEGKALIHNLSVMSNFISHLLSSDSALKFGSMIEANPQLMELLDQLPERKPNESMEEYIKKHKSGIMNSLLEDLSGMNAQDYKNAVQDMYDTAKIAQAAKQFNDRYKEFSENPIEIVKNRSKIEQALSKKVEQVKEKIQKKKSDDIARRFDFNESISTIAKTLDDNMEDIDKTGGVDEWMQNLSEDQQKKIKKAMSFRKALNGFKKAFDDTTDERIKGDKTRMFAKVLVEKASESAEDVETMVKEANALLNSEYLDNVIKKASKGFSEAAQVEYIANTKQAIKEILEANQEDLKRQIAVFENIEKLNKEEEKKAKGAVVPKEPVVPNAPKEPEMKAPEEKTFVIPKGSIVKDMRAISEANLGKSKPIITIHNKKSSPIKNANKKRYNRPQLTEYLKGAIDREKYADHINKRENESEIPKLTGGYSKDQYKNYVRAVHDHLESKGAFGFVKNGLKEDQEIEFYVDDELSQKVGSPIVLMRTADTKQVIGSMPSDIDFKSVPRGEEKTLQELEPNKYKLFREIVDAHAKYKQSATSSKKIINAINPSTEIINRAEQLNTKYQSELKEIGEKLKKIEDDNEYEKVASEFEESLNLPIGISIVNWTDNPKIVADTSAGGNAQSFRQINNHTGFEIGTPVAFKEEDRVAFGTVTKTKNGKIDEVITDDGFVVVKNGEYVEKYWEGQQVDLPQIAVPSESLHTTKVDKLMGGDPAWSNTESSVQDIFDGTGETPIIGIAQSNGFISTADTKIQGEIDQNILPGNLKEEGQLYVLVPSSSGKYVPALAWSMPLQEVLSRYGEDDWYIQKVAEKLQEAPSKINLEGSRYDQELFRWIMLNGMSVKAAHREKGRWIPDTSRKLKDATHIIINFDTAAEDGKHITKEIPLTDGKISKEDALETVKFLIKHSPETTTNVIISEMNSKNSADYIDHISKYLYTNIEKGQTHTINDWFTYKGENPSKTNAKSALNIPKGRPMENTRTITINGQDYTISDTDSTILKDGEPLDPTSQEYKEMVKLQSPRIEEAKENPVTEAPPTNPVSPVTKESLEEQIKKMSGNNDHSDNTTGNKKTQRPKLLAVSRVSNEEIVPEKPLHKDMEKLKNMFPQLDNTERIVLVNGMIKTTDEKGNPVEAYGMFMDGVLYLSDKAPRGTAFHEAFHYVTDMLLSDDEKEQMFKEAEDKYNSNDRMELEEKLAEDFRHYMNDMTDNSIRGFLKRIFERLKHIINSIRGNRNSTNNLFYDIYRDSYKRRIERKSASVEGAKKFMLKEEVTNPEQFAKEMEQIKINSIANGTFMKVRNPRTGELVNSNLNERQWLQVRTKAFKEWFGDWENDPANVSKAVDENNEPKVFYHGTDQDFDAFEIDEQEIRGSHRVHDKHSIFFTDSEEKAYKYKHKRVIPVFLNMRNPGFSSVLDGKYSKPSEYVAAENRIILDDKYDSAIFVRYDKEGQTMATPTTQWVVKNPLQIKSATDNTGVFATNDTNIYDTFEQDLLDYKYRKTDYSKLDAETKEYLTQRGISEEKYNSMAAEQREILLQCM